MIKPLPMTAYATPRPARAQSGPRPCSPEVRNACSELVADLPEKHRDHLVNGLERMRRADDLWQLRSAMFTAIALTHGEAEAQRRLSTFDHRVGL
jgi:hypothetical protein